MSELDKYIISGKQFQMQIEITRDQMLKILMDQWCPDDVIDLVAELNKKWSNQNFSDLLIKTLNSD